MTQSRTVVSINSRVIDFHWQSRSRARGGELDSENHILVGAEPAWEQFATEAGRFLAAD